ncbi:MAG: DUF1905 domain-containing protein [Mycobacteriales bacterium]
MQPATFTAELFRWKEDASWFFVALPEDVSDDIADEQHGPRSGFGAVPVQVSVGETTWTTSVFPDKQRGVYVLPVKRLVREREGLDVGVPFALTLTVR